MYSILEFGLSIHIKIKKCGHLRQHMKPVKHPHKGTKHTPFILILMLMKCFHCLYRIIFRVKQILVMV